MKKCFSYKLLVGIMLLCKSHLFGKVIWVTQICVVRFCQLFSFRLQICFVCWLILGNLLFNFLVL